MAGTGGELPEAKRRAVEVHLARCGYCRAIAKALVLGALGLAACCGPSKAPVAAAPDAGWAAGDSGTDAGSGFPTPIRYVVVIIKENHTFDNYFATFPGADGATRATRSDGSEVALPRCPAGRLPANPNHSHAAALAAWAGGAMNGFDVANPAPLLDGGIETFCTYGQAQIPNYWAYAQAFTLCDHFFSTSLSPSFGGHFAVATAQLPALDDPVGSWACDPAFGVGSITAIDPASCQAGATVSPVCFDVPSVVDALPPTLSWRAYGVVRADGELETPFASVTSVGGPGGPLAAHFRDVAQLEQDLADGDMANVTYLDGFPFDAAGHDLSEHPPTDPCYGENESVQIVDAIMQGPHWAETAILLSWDDWGGFYDHVAPDVAACSSPGPFFEGFRLPLLVISPYAKPGVFSGKAEQASIPRLIEDLFGLPRLSARDPHARDSIAGDLLPAFDFTQSPRPPLILSERGCP